MKKSLFFSLLAYASFLQISVLEAKTLQNDWQNLIEKTDKGNYCGLETKDLPFTFALYQGGGVSSLRLTDPSWGMGGGMVPQVTLKIGAYQNNFLFKPHHLTTIEAVIPAIEMAKIEAALGDTQSASFSFEGLEPNDFSSKKIGAKLAEFQSCTLSLPKGTVSVLESNTALP